MNALHLTGGWWPAVYPLRGRLGETQYTQLRPTGELATESVLFMPDLGPLIDRELARLAEQLPGDALRNAVLVDDAMLLPRTRFAAMVVGLDGGFLVVRQGLGAHACLLRSWVR
jgi:hypothetical protein